MTSPSLGQTTLKSSEVLRWRTRATVAITIAVASFGLALMFRLAFNQQSSDFDQIVVGAQRALRGLTPYTATALPGLEWPIYYPMPALVLGLPFAFLSLPWAHAMFVGISAGIFAWASSADDGSKLLGIFTWPYVLTVSLGQWGPLLIASALLPGLGWIAIVKPNLGLALAAGYAPRWARGRSLWINLLALSTLVIGSFALRPGWVVEWLAVLRGPTTHMIIPLTILGGPVLLLALIRWRLPEARFLAALACMPQTFSSYDSLLLFLVTRTRREALVMVAATTVMTTIVALVGPASTYAETVHRFASLRIAVVYLPAVIIVLRRTNRPAKAIFS